MIIQFLCQELDFYFFIFLKDKHIKYLKQRFKETKRGENERNFVIRPAVFATLKRDLTGWDLQYKCSSCKIRMETIAATVFTSATKINRLHTVDMKTCPAIFKRATRVLRHPEA